MTAGAGYSNPSGNNVPPSVQSGSAQANENAIGQTPTALRQANAYTETGNLVGNVDQVMIDTDSGKVAFVLIRRGSFLGLSPTWYAAPIEALNWRPNNVGYRLDIDQQALRGLPAIPAVRANLTTDVRRGELAQLYRDYSVRPYWTQQNSSQSAQAPRRRGAGERRNCPTLNE